jgi:hypothetical protein
VHRLPQHTWRVQRTPSATWPGTSLPTCGPLHQTQDALAGLQPTVHFEDVETKRRMHNLLHVAGVIDRVTQLRARPASVAELCLVHTPEYVRHVQVCFCGCVCVGGVHAAVPVPRTRCSLLVGQPVT